MNKIIRSSKQVRADIKKFGLSSIGKAKGAIDDSIKCGLALLELKEITSHGEWESEFKSAIDGVFGLRHGQKLMQIAAKKELLVLAPKDEILTINGAIEIITKASPEQIAEIEKNRLQAEREAEEASKVRKEAAEALAKQRLPEQSTPSNEPIEGDFKEVKPKKEEPEPEHNIELQEAVNILSERNDELEAEILSVCKVFESNDQLATAAAEIKKLTAVNVGLQSRVNGAQNERNELIRTLNHWKKRAEKAEKKLQENGIAV